MSGPCYTGPVNLTFPSHEVLELIARGIRETRISLAWSQRELSARSGVPQSRISRIERALEPNVPLSVIDRLLASMGARYRFTIEPPLIEPRQVDLVHARCSAHAGRRLGAAGWLVAREVEIGDGRSRGWIDLLAFDPRSRWLLVIEIKTELHDIGRIERNLNWYQRESWSAARRLGWQPRQTATALLVLMSDANDRVLAANRMLMATAFPSRTRTLRAVVQRMVEPTQTRYLAMLDPRSRATNWVRPTRIDGRYSDPPYRDYIDAIRVLDPAVVPRRPDPWPDQSTRT